MKHPENAKLALLCTAFAVATLAGCSGESSEKWIEVPLGEHTFHESSSAYRQGEYEILLLSNSDREFELGLEEGDTLVYEWTVDMEAPDLLYVEFHGHTVRSGDEPGTLMFYKKHNEGQESGALVAPFSGLHGWYLKNDSDQDITVKLTASGFYTEQDAEDE